MTAPFLFATGCSGINSCAEAWVPLGWAEAFCAEVEPFPAAVLAHRYGSGRPETMPDPALATNAKDRATRKAARKTVQRIPPRVPGAPPNLGDITRPDFVARAREVLAGRRLKVLCMGTPCQGFSVAGLRGSMKDARSNLMFCFVEAYHGLAATWAVWENVPGCLNTPDNAFGHLLAGLSGAASPLCGPDPAAPGSFPSAGLFYGPAGGGAWRVLDAQHLGGCELHGRGAVPQRRERVFIVFRAGAEGHTRAATVLFEPRGEGRYLDAEFATGAETAAHAGLGAPGVSKAITARQTSGRADPTADVDDICFCGGVGSPGVASPVTAKESGYRNSHEDNFVVETVTGQVTHALKAEGADGSQDGTGRGVHSDDRDAAPGPVLRAILAFGSKESAEDVGLVSPPLRAGGSNQGHQNGGVPPAVAIDLTNVRLAATDVSGTIDAGQDRGNRGQGIIVPAQTSPSPLPRISKTCGNGEGDVCPTITAQAAGDRPSDYAPCLVIRDDITPKFSTDVAFTVTTPSPSGGGHPQILKHDDLRMAPCPEKIGEPNLFALMPQNSGKDFKAKPADVAQPVMAAGPTTGNQGGDVLDEHVPALPADEAVAFVQNSRSEVRLMGGDGSSDGAVSSEPGAQQQTYIAARYVVRRFTCRETERLQGFPDDHTLIPWAGTKRRGQDMIDQRVYLSASGYTPAEVEALVHCPDGPRYKAVGNSKAVPVVRWIGARIEAVEKTITEKK